MKLCSSLLQACRNSTPHAPSNRFCIQACGNFLHACCKLVDNLLHMQQAFKNRRFCIQACGKLFTCLHFVGQKHTLIIVCDRPIYVNIISMYKICLKHVHKFHFLTLIAASSYKFVAISYISKTILDCKLCHICSC